MGWKKFFNWKNLAIFKKNFVRAIFARESGEFPSNHPSLALLLLLSVSGKTMWDKLKDFSFTFFSFLASFVHEFFLFLYSPTKLRRQWRKNFPLNFFPKNGYNWDIEPFLWQFYPTIRVKNYFKLLRGNYIKITCEHFFSECGNKKFFNHFSRWI